MMLWHFFNIENMQVKIFTIPCLNSNESNEELNRFLRANKVINVEKEFCVLNNEAFWSFCITYLQNQNTVSSQEKKEKVDYKEILDEASFAKFTLLRSFRKVLSEQDAVPAYAVFTDVELSLISQLEEISEKNILKIHGIGEKRLEKYGKKICEMYENQKNK